MKSFRASVVLLAVTLLAGMPGRASGQEAAAAETAVQAVTLDEVSRQLRSVEDKLDRLLRLFDNARRDVDSPFFTMNRQLEELDRRLDRMERDVRDIQNDVRRLR